jgi:hypothetical protein
LLSERFIHNASKNSIVESILRSNRKHKEIWINMFKLVFNEEPDLVINPVDSSLVVDDDIDQFILKD